MGFLIGMIGVSAFSGVIFLVGLAFYAIWSVVKGRVDDFRFDREMKRREAIREAEKREAWTQSEAEAEERSGLS